MSQFGAEKFTTRSREAIEAAQLLRHHRPATAPPSPVHLLVALLRDGEGTARTLVTKAGVDAAPLAAAGRGGAGRRCRAPAAPRSSSRPPRRR